MRINSQELAYWYLRLNGFLSIQNFIVHPDIGDNQRTDVDLMAVRFPFRSENLVRPMQDDAHFSKYTRPFVIFAEVKAGRCSLNGPWTNPTQQNMNRVLAALGVFTPKENKAVAADLYSQGFFENKSYRVSLFCISGATNPDISANCPQVPQILWPEILAFIFDRFRQYHRQKRSHGQWDQTGTLLWNKAEEFRRSKKAFCAEFEVV